MPRPLTAGFKAVLHVPRRESVKDGEILGKAAHD